MGVFFYSINFSRRQNKSKNTNDYHIESCNGCVIPDPNPEILFEINPKYIWIYIHMYIGEKYQDYLFKNQVNSKVNRKS